MDFLRFMRDREGNNGFSGPTLPGTLITSEAQLMERGYRTAPRQPSPHYQARIDEAQRLYDRVLTGNRWAALQFQEAMSMSDFSGYFGDILDRSILANYAECPYTWRQYCKAASINDFRQAKLFRFDRGASVLDGPILPNSYGASGAGPTGLAQVVEYPMRYRVESNYVDQLYKFGARMDFAWEVLVNDDLDALKEHAGIVRPRCPENRREASHRTVRQLGRTERHVLLDGQQKQSHCGCPAQPAHAVRAARQPAPFHCELASGIADHDESTRPRRRADLDRRRYSGRSARAENCGNEHPQRLSGVDESTRAVPSAWRAPDRRRAQSVCSGCWQITGQRTSSSWRSTTTSRWLTERTARPTGSCLRTPTAAARHFSSLSFAAVKARKCL